MNRADPHAPVVAVIDDDEAVREALRGLFRSVGLAVQTFESTADYLAQYSNEQAGCLVLDVRLPGQSGLEFQEELSRRQIRAQIVFISGHADVAMSVRAMKAGAVEFLTKPVRDQDLLDAVHLAIERDRQRRSGEKHVQQIRADFDSLTARERDVLMLVVAGERNRTIAERLSLSEATVKLHRSHIMRKLRAETLVGLVRLTDLYARHHHGTTAA